MAPMGATMIDGPPRHTAPIAALLDVARDAAHGVARPAAPLTTFVVGYVAALRGGGADAVRDVAAVTQRLALAHKTPDDDGPKS